MNFCSVNKKRAGVCASVAFVFDNLPLLRLLSSFVRIRACSLNRRVSRAFSFPVLTTRAEDGRMEEDSSRVTWFGQKWKPRHFVAGLSCVLQTDRISFFNIYYLRFRYYFIIHSDEMSESPCVG